MTRQRLLTLLLVGLAVVLSNHVLFQAFEDARADLTGDGLYSLTTGTERILERMQSEGAKPIDISLYFSATSGKTLPKFIKDFVAHERYVRSLLKEYRRSARGKVRLRFIDPLTDSDDEQDALDFGLDGKPINQHGDRFFFGLVFETQTGSREVIDFLWPDRRDSLEYEISKTINGLLWPSGKTVGVLSSLEVLGTADNPYLAQMLAAQGRRPEEKWIGVQLLEETYEVRKIETDVDSISPDEFDLVLVLHPKGLSEKTLFALDEWIVKGGNALIFLDNYAIDDRPPQNPQQPWQALQYEPSSSLDKLLAAWGLELPSGRFAADYDLALRRAVGPAGASESVVVDLAIDEGSRDQTLDASHPALQGLNELRFFLPGALEAAAEPAASLTPLVTTTAAGSVLEIEPGFGGGPGGLFYTDLNNPAKLRDAFTPGTEPVVLAYQITGQLPSAFPEGGEFAATPPESPPGLPPGVELPAPTGGETVRREAVDPSQYAGSTVIVFADVDFISDQIAFQRNFLGLVTAANDNHKLLLNSVDYLLGSAELMDVRAKHGIRRPFTRFDEIEAAAEEQTLERERQLRADVEAFQEQLREKQRELTQNAALLQKRVQDEVDELNEKVRDSNRQLREIRLARRQEIEREESRVRRSVLGWMPTAVLLVGLYTARRRRHGTGGPS